MDYLMSDNCVAVAALVSLVVVCSLSMSIPISRIETKMRKPRSAIETMRVAMRKPRLQFPWNVTLRPWESSSFLTFPLPTFAGFFTLSFSPKKKKTTFPFGQMLDFKRKWHPLRRGLSQIFWKLWQAKLWWGWGGGSQTEIGVRNPPTITLILIS